MQSLTCVSWILGVARRLGGTQAWESLQADAGPPAARQCSEERRLCRMDHQPGARVASRGPAEALGEERWLGAVQRGL